MRVSLQSDQCSMRSHHRIRQLIGTPIRICTWNTLLLKKHGIGRMTILVQIQNDDIDCCFRIGIISYLPTYTCQHGGSVINTTGYRILRSVKLHIQDKKRGFPIVIPELQRFILRFIPSQTHFGTGYIGRKMRWRQ